ncbi:MAG: tRNA-(ms[2]io[6]A)-hydroxylase [Myxococcales bacterium]|nr:tRNA-(ms[2]io[6]A)-hydroxylase [Myxococcales bacterium]
MIELAMEELTHFGQVHDLLVARGETIGHNQPDPYMGKLFKLMRRVDVNEYLLDRLVLFGIVEARGCERFRMVGDALPPGDAREFYVELTRCEARHHALFLRFAREIFGGQAVTERLDQLLDAEAEVVRSLEIRSALH